MKASALSRYAAMAISVGIVLGTAIATSSGLAAADEPDLELSVSSDSVFACGQSVTAVARIVNTRARHAGWRQSRRARYNSISSATVVQSIPSSRTISYAEGDDAARWPM
jgi:hypothetical protein